MLIKKIINRIVRSSGSPDKNDLWLDDNLNLKVHENEEWKTIAGGGEGSGGGDSDSDIQIVELTYDHLPATGTLSASDLAKLDSDNCLLIINGKYFRKTFSSDGGIDYKEIGLTTVLGGVRSIYFTASTPDGEYTIAYTYPVEANTQTQANATLENIKVGNTTYSIPLSPMVVSGTIDGNGYFTPGSGAPTWAEAQAHMSQGGLVYLIVTAIGEPDSAFLAIGASGSSISALTEADILSWINPGDDEPVK